MTLLLFDRLLRSNLPDYVHLLLMLFPIFFRILHILVHSHLLWHAGQRLKWQKKQNKKPEELEVSFFQTALWGWDIFYCFSGRILCTDLHQVLRDHALCWRYNMQFMRDESRICEYNNTPFSNSQKWISYGNCECWWGWLSSVSDGRL